VGSSEVLKACGPCNVGKQNSQIITFTLLGLHKVHAPHSSQCDMIVSAYTPLPRCLFPEVPRLFGFAPHSDFEIIRVQCGQRSKQWRCRVVAVANQSGCSRVFRFGLSVEVTPPSQSGGVVAHHGFPNCGPLRKVSGLLIRQMNSQAVNIWVHVVQVKGKKPMESFVGTDIPPIKVILDFIPGGRHIVPIGPTCNRLRHYSRQSPSFRLHHY